ncbi:hypothetical protein [Burkholderia sp. Tr-20390]|uniref:hypothetical protein n=1 Tax=Burkholderia sp. Tr-20390 TaxID=2703904 RepID=UPI001980FEA1|nr:hypothetical protein [Burkholderia sp. Tr-20390]MBN3731864.1 hypothetical protein [Burkholderia sp. Tr-20390]
MLNRLKQEVLDRGPEACLPTRLSDEWLSTLAKSADTMLGNAEDGSDGTGAECLAVLLCLLQAKTDCEGKRIEIPFEQMREYFVRYRIELGLEEVRRRTNTNYEPATLDTIFTDRAV